MAAASFNWPPNVVDELTLTQWNQMNPRAAELRDPETAKRKYMSSGKFDWMLQGIESGRRAN